MLLLISIYDNNEAAAAIVGITGSTRCFPTSLVELCSVGSTSQPLGMSSQDVIEILASRFRLGPLVFYWKHWPH
jgi:hypothetical protein